jgi:hypothetical protein
MCVSIVCALAAGIVILSSASCVASPANSTRADSFTVGDSATLVVDSLNGRIQIEDGSGNKVDVQATIRDTAGLRYDVVQNGNQITVTAARTGGWQLFGNDAGADIHVSVPAGIILSLRTSNGDIDVQGTIRGGVLKTSNGRVVLQNVKGDFDGSTSNGRIEVTGLEGSGLFKTSNGKVDLQGIAGSCNASTSNGTISFSGEMKPGGQNRLVTSNGSVSVELKGTPSVTLDASTSNGKVSSALPILATNTGNTSLAGKIGAGESTLYIRTSNGSVTIK